MSAFSVRNPGAAPGALPARGVERERWEQREDAAIARKAARDGEYRQERPMCSGTGGHGAYNDCPDCGGNGDV